MILKPVATLFLCFILLSCSVYAEAEKETKTQDYEVNWLCIRCGKVADLFAVRHHRAGYFGICVKCARELVLKDEEINCKKGK